MLCRGGVPDLVFRFALVTALLCAAHPWGQVTMDDMELIANMLLVIKKSDA